MVHQVVWSDTEPCDAGGHVARVGAVARGASAPEDWGVEDVTRAVAEGGYFYLVDDEGFPQLVAPERCGCGAATLVADPGPRAVSGWTLRLMTRRRYLWQQVTGAPPEDGTPDDRR